MVHGLGGPEGAGAWGEPELVDEAVEAGAWALRLRLAELAELDFAGRRVVRGVRFIVRDADWRTAENVLVTPAEVSPERVRLQARARLDGEDVAEWELAARFAGDRLAVDVTATLLRDFARNRIGLIVLHGTELAGAPLEVVHPDGATELSAFPTDIAPHQPALEVAGYRWRHGGIAAELDLRGEVFEMEDQRNWTDASFKTYSTRLAEPFPVRLAACTTIAQSLELRCTVAGAADATADAAVPPLRLTPTADRLPELRLLAPFAQADGSQAPETDAPLALLVELNLEDADWPEALAEAARSAARRPLDVRVATSDPARLAQVEARLDGVAVARLGAFDPDTHISEPDLLAAAGEIARRLGTDVAVVGGTRAHFTELNRNIDRLGEWRGDLAFSVTPQMHDRSRQQLVESLGVQRLVAQQAVRMAKGRRVHVGPVTLRPRFNAVATTPGLGRRLPGPDAHDPRQASAAAAAWALAAVAALGVPGIASIALGEAAGERGLVTDAAGRVTAAGRVLRWLAEAGELLPLEPPGDAAAAIAWIAQRRSDDRVQLLVAELAGTTAELRVPEGWRVVAAEDAEGAERAAGADTALAPFETLRLLLAPM